MRRTVDVERGSNGRRFAVARELTVSPERAWTALAETMHWPAWGPTVSDVRPREATVSEGLRGEVRVLDGPWVPFEVWSVTEEKSSGVRRWTWRVARVPATGHRVEPTPNGCRVVFEVPLWAAGYVPVCRRALGRLASMLE
jgi:hypothetical protein